MIGLPPERTARPVEALATVESTAARQAAPIGPDSLAQPANVWSKYGPLPLSTWHRQAAFMPPVPYFERAYYRAASTWACNAAAGHDDDISLMPRRYSSWMRRELTTSRVLGDAAVAAMSTVP